VEVEPYYDANMVTLYLGDCRDVMRAMPDASVDAIVTDPPYELGFMGKHWDGTGIAYLVEMWREALRVLKPGGHLAAFGGTRTYHRMACAIEDAGFEVRDCLAWMYGSGFPKSLDVSKAIDKRRDDSAAIRTVTAFVAAARDRSPLTNRDIDDHFGFNGMAGHWTTQAAEASVPTWEQWRELRTLLALGEAMDAEVWRLNGRKGTPGEAWAEREIIGRSENGIAGGTGKHAGEAGAYGFGGTFDITAPATDAARQWAGWGTALKPAYEPIVLARKPLIGTVAANVLAHGTGALNIDATRIDADWEHEPGRGHGWLASGIDAKSHDRPGQVPDNVRGSTVRDRVSPLGRWPANVLLDEEAAAILDAEWAVQSIDCPSRFFYVAKASRSEREAGLEEFEPARRTDAETRDDASPGSNNPRLRTNQRRNDHPTVKPVDVMRWLCRLVTPPGGVVLDPFNGSGTTGMAALDEGFRYIGIEQEPRYIEIARQRITHRHVIETAQVEPNAELVQGRML